MSRTVLAALLLAVAFGGGQAGAQRAPQAANPEQSADPGAAANSAALANSAARANSAAIANSAAVANPGAGGYSAAGLYNLANAYARAGQPGMAVLNYERAALLAPDDPDIQANLNEVRAALKLPAQPSGRFARLVRLASPDVVAWIGVFGILIIGASALAPATRRLQALRIAGWVVGIAALGFTTGNAVAQWPKLREAVVIVKETPLRVSPVPMGDPLLQLTEAQTVTITAQHEDFVLVRTHDGRDGWAARADLADVVPHRSLR